MNLPNKIKVTLLLIAAIASYFLITVRINGEHSLNENTKLDSTGNSYKTQNWQYLISGDGHGYYAYLPSVFINGNFGKFESDKEPFVLINNHSVIKQTCGTAICQFPFFIVAYAYSNLSDKPEDGYSKQFQLMIGMAGLFYLLIGLFAISKILLRFDIKSKAIVAILLLITFATNLFYYAVFEPSMCHVYAFAMEAVFLYSALEFFRNNKLITLLIAAISLAILILIRPVDGLIVLILPFILFSKMGLYKKQDVRDLNDERCRSEAKGFKRSHFLIAAICFVVVISIQSILWFIQCGKLFVDTYVHEGFYFLNPVVLKSLFGFNRGFFIYTPFMILVLIGFYQLYKFSIKFAIGFAITFSAIIYITASWWCWNYSDGFGLRPLVDHYALFAIPVAFCFNSIKNISARILLIGFSIFCLLLGIIQTYQYQTNIMHHFSMDWNKYKYIFFETDTKFRNALGGNFDVKPFHSTPPGIVFNQKIKTDFSLNQNINDTTILTINDLSISGWMYLELALKRTDFSLNSSANAFVKMVLYDDNNRPVYNYQLRMNDYPDDYFILRKRYFNYKVRLPKKLPPFSKMDVKMINNQRGEFSIHDVGIKVLDFSFADK